MIPDEDTDFGFIYGAATVERHMSDKKKGWVVIGVKTPKANIQIYITKTGKVRVYNYHGGELLEDKEGGRV